MLSEDGVDMAETAVPVPRSRMFIDKAGRSNNVKLGSTKLPLAFYSFTPVSLIILKSSAQIP